MLLNCDPGTIYIQPVKLAADWLVGIDAPQDHIGIGNGWSVIAKPITHRARI